MSRPKILIVEDVPVAQKMVVLIVERLDCDVDAASDGATALECVGKQDYDLILLDLGLPDMDGMAVTEAIRKLEREGRQRTPIVILTAHVESDYRDRCLTVGVDDFIKKPLTRDSAQRLLAKFTRETS